MKTYWFAKVSFFYLSFALFVSGVILPIYGLWQVYAGFKDKKHLDVQILMDRSMFLTAIGSILIILGMLIYKIVMHFDNSSVASRDN